MMFDMLIIAQRLLSAGLSVIPIKADGSKGPAVSSWKPYQERLATDTEARHWFTGTNCGLAVLGGAVSGGLEILDFDEPGLYDEWAALCEDQGLGPLLETLPLAATGGGGRHVYYRCASVAANTKLAQRWEETRNKGKGGLEVLIETRGEGGYAIIPPSPAACHPDGQPYEYLRGNLAAVPTITAAQREELWMLARALNQWYPEFTPSSASQTAAKTTKGEGLSPGDDYNARGRWEPLLTPFGLTRKRVQGETEFWGWADNGRAVCATVNHGGSGLFYNWSTSAYPFEAEKAYDLFGAYARLHHGGDFTAAAKALAAEGYGSRSPRPPAGPPPNFYSAPLAEEESYDPEDDFGQAEGGFSPDDDEAADIQPENLVPENLFEYPFSDLGNAQRLVGRWGHNLRYAHLWERWLIWDGKRWAPDMTGEIQRSARETIAYLKRRAAVLPDKKHADTLWNWAIKSESASRLNNMVNLAHDEPGVPVPVERLDQQPMRLTVENGTIDLTTGKLGPHRRGDLITKMAPVVYDPDAACPRWEAFLSRIMDGRQDLIQFLQRALGFSLTGDTRRRALIIFYGNQGRNGKSTLIDTIHTMLGDYALNTAPEVLMVRRGESANTNDIARLRGARFVAARESEDGQRLSESVVKQMTGGDIMTARFLYQESFDFKPEFKLFLATNHKPQVRATDEGFWDRIRLVPFTQRIPEDEVDPELPGKLLEELPGILAWCVRGCLMWRQEGLGTAEAIEAATQDYRTENDALGLFLDACCTRVPHARTPASQLYKAYEAWCIENGQYCLKQAAFGRKLSELNIPAEKGSGGIVSRIGIGLTVDVDED